MTVPHPHLSPKRSHQVSERAPLKLNRALNLTLHVGAFALSLSTLAHLCALPTLNAEPTQQRAPSTSTRALKGAALKGAALKGARRPLLAVLDVTGPSLKGWFERAERNLQEDLARLLKGEPTRQAINWRASRSLLPKDPRQLKLTPFELSTFSEQQRTAFEGLALVRTISTQQLKSLLPPEVPGASGGAPLATSLNEGDVINQGRALGADWILSTRVQPMGPVLKVEWSLYDVRLTVKLASHFSWSKDPEKLLSELPEVTKVLYRLAITTINERKRAAEALVREHLHQEALARFEEDNPMLFGRAPKPADQGEGGGAEGGAESAHERAIDGLGEATAEAQGGAEGGEPKDTRLWSERAAEALAKAQLEMDEVQRTLDDAYHQRRARAEQKRKALEIEAAQAWEEIQTLVGPSPSPETLKAQGGRWRWEDVTKAMQGSASVEKKRQLLEAFVEEYEEAAPFQAQRLEAQERLTWLPSSPELITVRQGRFLIGAANAFADEWPRQWVEIKAFLGGLTEVTNAHYKTCVDAGVCTPPHWDDNRCHIFSVNPLSGHKLANGALPAIARRGDLPVVCVTWQQANQYATWTNARLLSEAEWEFVARSGDRTYVYPWGRAEPSCEYAVMTIPIKMGGFDAKRFETGCGFGSFLPVCSRPEGANSYGMCDLAGNVWEWVTDTYQPSHKGASPDGSPVLGRGLKVIRGGSFASSGRELRASTRGQREPNEPASYIGFRIARDFE